MKKIEKLINFAILFLGISIFLIVYGFTFFGIGTALKENGCGTYLLEFIFISIPLFLSLALLVYILLLMSGKIETSKIASLACLGLFVITLFILFNLLATYSGNWLGYLLVIMFSVSFLLLFCKNRMIG